MTSATPPNAPIYRVTMRLAPDDLENTTALEEALGARSKADAISQALAIARMVVESMQRGQEVLLRKPGSDTVERIILPKVRLQPASAAAGQAA